MAAPNNTTWGSVVNDSGRIGIYTSIKRKNGVATVTEEVWFWSKNPISDSSTWFEFNSILTNSIVKTNISVSTTNDSEWSKYNQKKIFSHTEDVSQTTSDQTFNLLAYFDKVDVVGDLMSASREVTISALSKYTISYHMNGGYGSIPSQTKTEMIDLTLTDTIPSRTGYTFLGWSTDKNAEEPTYLAGGIFTIDAATVLYAIWKAKEYIISYNANGGSGAPSSQTKTYGTDLTLSSITPTRSGWTFIGWGTSANDTSVDYAAGGSYTSNSKATLYAIWRKTVYLYYNVNGGIGAPSASMKYIYNSTTSASFTITSTVPEKEGHVFLGWSRSDSALSASYTAGKTISISSSTTLYAVWKKNSGSVFTKVNSTWKKGIAFDTDSNLKKRKGKVKIKVNGKWKDGICDL